MMLITISILCVVFIYYSFLLSKRTKDVILWKEKYRRIKTEYGNYMDKMMEEEFERQGAIGDKVVDAFREELMALALANSEPYGDA